LAFAAGLAFAEALALAFALAVWLRAAPPAVFALPDFAADDGAAPVARAAPAGFVVSGSAAADEAGPAFRGAAAFAALPVERSAVVWVVVGASALSSAAAFTASAACSGVPDAFPERLELRRTGRERGRLERTSRWGSSAIGWAFWRRAQGPASQAVTVIDGQAKVPRLR
jgi:hypothetical protein